MSSETERKRLAVLRVLRNGPGPLGSAAITESLLGQGYDVRERSVRLYLQELDAERFTEKQGAKGHRITDAGIEELASAKAIEKIGLLAAKIDQLTYCLYFDLSRRKGAIVVNLTLVEKAELPRYIPLLIPVVEKGFAMGKLVTLFAPGERIGGTEVPEGTVGIGTVCSITVNGVLLSRGVPTTPRFGGLLEIVDGAPGRFVDRIHYDGTTVDPLEVFIRSGMTDCLGAVRTGSGVVGAGFREVPGVCRVSVLETSEELEEAGLGGICMVGWPGQPLLEMPVSEERLGMIVFGSLNPIAVLKESRLNVPYAGALAGHADYRRLFPYTDLEARSRDFV